MTHTYRAFIDESGDDGLRVPFRISGGRGGSSRWLVISACLIRSAKSLEAVAWRDEILARMPERKSRILHFKDLNHGQRVAAAQVLAAKPVRIMSVIASKESIDRDLFKGKNQLYFYMTRYLIERISWACRDLRPSAPEGDGRVQVTFSRRGGMQYDAFQDYMRHLKASGGDGVSVHWPVIDIESVEASDHSKSASLQLVDIAASAFASGFEPDPFGNCETRYAEILKPVTYNRKRNYLSYGVKLLPRHQECKLSDEQLRMIELWE